MSYDINNYNKFYLEKIFPIMEYLEPIRQKKYLQYQTMKIISIAIGLLTFVVPFVGFHLLSGLGLLGVLLFAVFVIPITCLFPLFACMIFIISSQSIKKKFKKILKDAYMPKILSHFENLKYKDQEIPKGLYKESGIFSTFDIIKSDDVFTGKYQDIWFHIEETYLYKAPGIYTGRYGATSFKGVVIVLPMNKTIKSQTIISSKNDKNINNLQPNIIPTFVMIIGLIILLLLPMIISGEYYGKIMLYVVFFIGALIYLIYDTARKSKKYEGIKLEDIGFDSRFAVYSKDQIEARYLVTPTFMEKLYKLQTAFGTKNIKCSFFGKKLMFAISTDRDLFEIGNLFTPLTDSSQMYQFIEELTAVYDMIDYFKLAERTGL